MPADTGNLRDRLAAWEREGLIDADEVAAIVEFEHLDEGQLPSEEHESRVPMVAEAIGYVGSALVLAAVVLLISQNWDDLAVGIRVAVMAVPTVFAAIIGWRVGRGDDPALVRSASVLWALAVAGVAATATVVWVDIVHNGDPPTHGGLLAVSAVASGGAAAMYRARPLALQQLVLFVGSLITALGIVDVFGVWRGDAPAVAVFALVAIVVGAAWTALGLDGRVAPPVLATVTGPATILVGAQVMRGDLEVVSLWLGIACAIALVVVGVWRSDVIVLLAGTVGLFQWAPQLAVFHLADALGTALTLMVVGVLLLGAAYGFTVLYGRVRDSG